MARYSTFKYGTGVKWGAAEAAFTTTLWGVEIEWNGVDFVNEAARCVDFNASRGRNFFVKPDGSGLEFMDVGWATVKLSNRDGRFDAFNTGSPLYPNVKPGKFIRVSARHTDAGSKEWLFSGIVDDIQNTDEQRTGERWVTIRALDGWQWLRDRTASIPVRQNIQTGAAVDQVLDDVDWPLTWGRAIDSTSDDTIPFWWVDQRNAALELHDLNESEFGALFVAADGKLTFFKRNKVQTPVATLTQGKLLRDISVPQPWETVRDIIRILVHAKKLQVGATLWTYLETPPVYPGETLTVWATFTFSNRPVAAINVISPVSGTDFKMHASGDGAGEELTANFTVTPTIFSESAKLDVKNNGTKVGHITLLQIRGDAVDEPSTAFVEDQIAGGGERTLTLDNPNQQDTEKSIGYARFLRDLLSPANPFPVVSMKNQWNEGQLAADLQDLVTLTIAKLGVNDSFRVGKIEHQWVIENGQELLTTWRTEPTHDPAVFNFTFNFALGY